MKFEQLEHKQKTFFLRFLDGNFALWTHFWTGTRPTTDHAIFSGHMTDLYRDIFSDSFKDEDDPIHLTPFSNNRTILRTTVVHNIKNNRIINVDLQGLEICLSEITNGASE